MQVSQTLITFLFRYPIAHCSKDWVYAYLTLWFRQQASTHMGHKGHLFLEAKFHIDGIMHSIMHFGGASELLPVLLCLP